MTAQTSTDIALSHVEALLADAPAHVRERWTEVRTHLLEASSDDAGEIAAATPYEDDLLKHIRVSSHMFDGPGRSMEITIEFPFAIGTWFNGHSHFELAPRDHAGGAAERDLDLEFYQRQDTERKRLVTLIESSIAPIAFDCLRRLLARDVRRDDDSVLYGLRDAAWRAGGMAGPQPQPAGAPPVRRITVVDGVRQEVQG